jgi:hypothetical protein
MDIVQLLLEVKVNGRVVDDINLLSHESRRGMWDADKIILL